MESLINRYRNITILLLVILAQLVLLAVQVKNDQEVRMIRVWAVTAVTPLARALEGLRSGTVGFFTDYVMLRDVHEENHRLRSDLDRLKMENLFLKTELSTADRAKALSQFEARTPSRTLAARVIMTGAGANSKVVYLDRGSLAGVERGMAVVTPDGIVGKVLAAYPTASEVLLITDADFAAGVISQKTHVRGILKGQGHGTCKVDYVPNEQKVEVGEMFYTSGDDRIFPKGFPAAVVRVVRPGPQYADIIVEPSGMERGLEEVLILIEGVHQAVPDAPPQNNPVYLMPPATSSAAAEPAGIPEPGAANQTDADRLLDRYKAIGAAENHKFGEGLPGSKPPDFNIVLPAQPKPAGPVQGPAATPPAPAAAKPAAPKTQPAPAAAKPAAPKTQPAPDPL